MQLLENFTVTSRGNEGGEKATVSESYYEKCFVPRTPWKGLVDAQGFLIAVWKTCVLTGWMVALAETRISSIIFRDQGKMKMGSLWIKQHHALQDGDRRAWNHVGSLLRMGHMQMKLDHVKMEINCILPCNVGAEESWVWDNFRTPQDSNASGGEGSYYVLRQESRRLDGFLLASVLSSAFSFPTLLPLIEGISPCSSFSSSIPSMLRDNRR